MNAATDYRLLMTPSVPCLFCCTAPAQDMILSEMREVYGADEVTGLLLLPKLVSHCFVCRGLLLGLTLCHCSKEETPGRQAGRLHDRGHLKDQGCRKTTDCVMCISTRNTVLHVLDQVSCARIMMLLHRVLLGNNCLQDHLRGLVAAYQRAQVDLENLLDAYAAKLVAGRHVTRRKVRHCAIVCRLELHVLLGACARGGV